MERVRWLRSPGMLAAAAAAIVPVVLAQAAPPPPGLSPAPLAAVRAVQALPLPAVDGLATWVVPRDGRRLIDDFETRPWPAPGTWALVTDLTGAADGDYAWAPTTCRAASAQASLWAVGGGADGSRLACGAAYPPAQQTSAVLGLDLAATHSAAAVDLVLDIWADAGPNEGLFVNYFDYASGDVPARRTVMSATGRSVDWQRGVRLDLTDLRDALDPAWHGDLRGRTGYLELLFASIAGVPGGEGILVDNIAVESRARGPVVVTPGVPTAVPTPGNNVIGCTGGADCGTLIVEAFDDYRCDGRYRAGLDFPLRGPARVDVTAGAVRLEARLGASGLVYFRVPMSGGASVQVSPPAGYADCPGAPNPRAVRAADFGRRRFARLTFGFYRP